MSPSLKSHLEREIKFANERGADRYRGSDWLHLTREEEAVFAIDRARFPRMLTAWTAYERFMKLTDEGFCDDNLIAHERKRRPNIVSMGVSINGFQHFAKEYAGMTFREAHAMYCKHEFWQVRNGIAAYTDEPKGKRIVRSLKRRK